MEFIVTIDTEGDNQWDHGCELTTENIKYIPRFQQLCEKYRVKPTYLVTTEICEDFLAKEIISDYVKADNAEIGAHLHAWSTSPFKDQAGYRKNDRNHAFAHELPIEYLSEKIETLTHQIEASFNKRPRSFRSGRYGFNKQVAEVLAEKKYLVDSSVTPFIDWSEYIGLPTGNGGPDFTDNTPLPFMYKFEHNSLLEIPITILPTKFPLNLNDNLARYYFRNVNNRLLLKAFRRIYLKHQPLWMRPNLWMNQDYFNDLIREAERRELPYLVMMFHSSELMPGCSIYWQNKDDVEKLFDSLEALFDSINSKEIKSVTLTEAAKNFQS